MDESVTERVVGSLDWGGGRIIGVYGLGDEWFDVFMSRWMGVLINE